MGRLAAGCCAGVENPFAGLRVEQLGSTLGAQILHAHQPFGKTRDLFHRHGLIEHQPVHAHAPETDTGRLEAPGGFVLSTQPAIGPQAEGGTVERGGQNGFPLAGPDLAHTGHPPARMVVAGLIRQIRGDQRVTFAHEAAQRGVHEAGCRRMGHAFG